MLRACSFLLLTLATTALLVRQDRPQSAIATGRLDQNLPPEQTVAALSARLKLLTGDLDPNLLKNLANQLKSNPKMSPEDWLKKLGKDGNGKGFDELLKTLQKDPKAFDSLKQFAEKFGKDGLTNQQLMEWLKKFGEGMKAPEISQFQVPKLEGGSLDGAIPKFDGKLPDFTPGKFELPEGSAQWLQDAITGWEKNVGSINASPEMKANLENFFKNGDGFKTGDLKNWFGEKGFNLKQFDGLFGKNDLNFKMPNVPDGPRNLKLPDWNGPNWGNGPSMPSAPSFGGGWSLPSFGMGGGGASAAIPILVVIGLILVAGIVWWMWPQIQAMRSANTPAALPLPDNFDPRSVNDRESLVKAFEVISMILCGNPAKVWNHETIGQALREFLKQDPEGINRLAVAYAMARYTPKGEPLKPESVFEARRTLCRLAGVPEA